MDRQELNRLILERLSSLNADSVELTEDDNRNEDSYILKVVSKEFAGVSVLKRIRMIYPMIESILLENEIHLEINPLSIKESKGDFDKGNAGKASRKSNPGLAANP